MIFDLLALIFEFDWKTGYVKTRIFYNFALPIFQRYCQTTNL